MPPPPVELDAPCPSELDVASRVYGPALPRSPEHARKWQEHARWVSARHEYVQQLDAAAREAWRAMGK